ncbi:MAG: beta-ketoacyl-[acyl-carrier-protein] synthase II, partial [Candidatus Omnitrophota bacterium]
GALSVNNQNPEAVYRPFDRQRSGFVIGEGAGIVVMEGVQRARQRGANILGYISGYGTSCDGVDRINPSSDGKELARAINTALEDAKVNPRDIDYISLDGLAVDIWDDSEINALKIVFGDALPGIPASCPKSMFGNLLGASGALDMIIAILSMEHGLVPPTLNLEDPVAGGIDYVSQQARERKINKCLVISRGRGGINAALVVEKA